MLLIRKKVRAQPRSSSLCMHKYIRGANQGKFCDEKAMIGYRYCKLHFNKNKYTVKLLSKLERHMGDLLDVKLYKNKFGEYEDPYTGFIFSLESQKILGKRTNAHGAGGAELDKLNVYDIALSLKKGWEIYSDDGSDAESP